MFIVFTKEWLLLNNVISSTLLTKLLMKQNQDNSKIVQLTYQYIFKVILHLLNTVLVFSRKDLETSI